MTFRRSPPGSREFQDFARPPDRHRRTASFPVRVGDAQHLWPSASGIKALFLGLELRAFNLAHTQHA